MRNHQDFVILELNARWQHPAMRGSLREQKPTRAAASRLTPSNNRFRFFKIKLLLGLVCRIRD